MLDTNKCVYYYCESMCVYNSNIKIVFVITNNKDVNILLNL